MQEFGWKILLALVGGTDLHIKEQRGPKRTIVDHTAERAANYEIKLN
jgi:hypothetical protein